MWKNVFNKFIKDMSLTENPYFKKRIFQNKLILKGHLYFIKKTNYSSFT